MSDKLMSIIAEDSEIKLETNKSDIAAVLIKGIVGAAPFVGPIIAETVSSVIPSQKLERLILFTEVLEMKINNLEGQVNEKKFKSPEFTDLLEDAMMQASRAISKERIEYITTLISKSLTTDEASHLREKWLLGLLGQLNDAEIIILKHKELQAAHGLYNESKDFAAKHKDIIDADFEFENHTFLEAYEAHLERL